MTVETEGTASNKFKWFGLYPWREGEKLEREKHWGRDHCWERGKRGKNKTGQVCNWGAKVLITNANVFGFLTPTSNCLVPAECLAVYINSETTYPEILSDCTVKGSVPCDRPPLQMPVSSPGCYLCFWPTGSKFQVPTTPSLGSINLLEWVTELRETFYLLNLQFLIKEYNTGTARRKNCIGQGMGKGYGASKHSENVLLSHISLYSPTWKFSELPLFGL